MPGKVRHLWIFPIGYPVIRLIEKAGGYLSPMVKLYWRTLHR